MKLNIGTKIKHLRRERGITQEELADALHISSQAVSKWENGIALPDITLAPLIARYFGITMDALFDFQLREREAEIEAICLEGWRYRASDPGKSRAILEKGLEKYPDDEILLNNLLYVIDPKREAATLIRIASHLIAQTNDAEIRYDALRLLSYAYEARGERDNAVAALEQIPEIYFTKLTELACLLDGQGKYDAAHKQKWISFEHLLQMMGQLTVYYEDKGETAAALAEARRARRLLEAFADEGITERFGSYRREIAAAIERLGGGA